MLDFNERERANYSEMLSGFSKYAALAADAFKKNDDQEFLLNFLMMTFGLKRLQEFSLEVGDSMKKMQTFTPDSPEYIKDQF